MSPIGHPTKREAPISFAFRRLHLVGAARIFTWPIEDVGAPSRGARRANPIHRFGFFRKVPTTSTFAGPHCVGITPLGLTMKVTSPFQNCS